MRVVRDRSSKYTPAELLDLRAESAAAAAVGVTWKERGPVGKPGAKFGHKVSSVIRVVIDVTHACVTV